MKPTAKKSAAKAAAKAPVKSEPATTAERFYVPLDKLQPDPKNVRRYGSDAGLAELVATITAKGLINNLLVRPNPAKRGHYYVTAGARRLRALKEIAKTNGTIAGHTVAKDWAAPVLLAREDDNAVELSLIENFARLAMNEADQIEGFRALVEDEGQSPEQIAATFGLSHMTVRRRVKLAKLSPRLIAEFREGRANLQQMEALAGATSHEAQERAWFDAPEWNRRPDAIKRLVARDEMRGDHNLVEFVTAEAYKAAGGAVEADLFADDGDGFYERELITRLATEKLEAMADALRAEGWAFVRYYLSGADFRGDAQLCDAPVRATANLTEVEKAKAAEIEAWLSDNDADSGAHDPDEWQARSDRLDAMLSPKPADYPEAWRPYVGAAVFVEHGAAITTGGLCVVGAMPEIAAEPADEKARQPAEASAPALSGAIWQDLTTVKSRALACDMAQAPNAALAYVVHNLALSVFRDRFEDRYFYGVGEMSPLRIIAQDNRMSDTSADEQNAGAFSRFEATLRETAATLPAKAHDLLEWCLSADHKTLMRLLAVCVGAQIDTRADHYKPATQAMADTLAGALNTDLTKYWTPSAAYFGRLSKKAMAEAMTEAGVPAPVVAGLAKLKKNEAVALAVAEIRKNCPTWLPAPLRTQPAAAADVEDESAADGAPAQMETPVAVYAPALAPFFKNIPNARVATPEEMGGFEPPPFLTH